MKKLLFVLIVVFSLLFPGICLASVTETGIESQLDKLDLSELTTAVSRSSIAKSGNVDFNALIRSAISGSLDLSPQNIISLIASSFLSEISSMIDLLRNLILIAILSAFFKTLSGNFSQKSVSEIGFYANFAAVTALLISSFHICLSIGVSLITEVCDIMAAAAPVLVGVLAMSGSVSGAYMFSPFLLFAVNFISNLMRSLFVPAISLVFALNTVNEIAEKDILTKFCALARRIISWGIKTLAAVFVGIMTIQSLSSPIVNKTLLSSAKSVVGMVPLVGSALTQATDTVLAWMNAVKSGVLIAVVVVVLLICAAPLIKIAAFVFLYRLTAALIQPICDERIVDAIDGAGTFAALVLSSTAFCGLMFVFMTMMLLAF